MGNVRHIQSFQNRMRMSPQQFHAKWAFPPDAKCQGCGALHPVIRAIVMIPADEAEKRGMIPPGAAKTPKLFPQIAPILVPIRESGTTVAYYIRISKVYACKSCQRKLELALAKAPSWAIVEINRGPDPTNKVVSGYGGSG